MIRLLMLVYAIHTTCAGDHGLPLTVASGASLRPPSPMSSTLFLKPLLASQAKHDSKLPDLLQAEDKTLQPGQQFHQVLSQKELLHYFGTNITQEVPEYVITPLRHVSGSRRRRSLTSAKDKLEYHVTVFGQDYMLQLQHNNNLMSAGCIVEQRLNGSKVISSCFQRGNDGNYLDNDCYYTGTSTTHSGSTVAVSACNGLHGIISVSEHDHDLVIRPIKTKHSADILDIEGRNLHLVFKRQTRQRQCGGTDIPIELDILKSRSSPQHQDRRITKRSSDDLYIELLLVADKTLLDFHGEDLKNYLMTITNVAAARLLDASLGHSIHISVVKIQILDKDQPGLEIVEDALHGLKSFCDWQEKTNIAEDDHPQHYDAAVLFTKLDLTNTNGDRSTVGMATIGGICVANSRCMYVEDTGIDAGLTLAHEAGHSLGIKHDAANNTCYDFTNMMSSGGATGPSSFKWSSCSKDALHAFIESGKTWCLVDMPTGEEPLSKDLPGVVYDADDQCMMWAGTSYYDHTDPCSQLWCHHPHDINGILKGSSPMMDGSMCGDRKYCINAQCEDIGEDGPPAVDGGWSAWSSEWSDCSRTCGGGVMTKVRLCNNPKPRFGGHTCPGASITTDLCNMKPCSPTEQQYKEEQCKATRDQPVGGRIHDWISWNVQGDQECYLLCKSQTDGRIYRRTMHGSNNYKDGTSCTGTQTNQFYKCVHGSCQAISCDGHSGTNYTFDVCGVCGGSSDTCTKMTGTSTPLGEANKWTVITKFVRGTSGIQLDNKNRLTKISLSVEGQLLFNADPSISASSGSYSLQGVTFTYRRDDGQDEEMIAINGPLQTDVEAQVYTSFTDPQFQPRVVYEFYTPLVNKTDHEWNAQITSCSVQCDGGTYKVNVTCRRKNDSFVVEDRLCDIYNKPSTTGAPCNTQECRTLWSPRPWSSCSGSCGEGTQTRQMDCVRQSPRQDVVVDGDQCKDELKPEMSRTCHVTPCDAQWITGNWSSCSLTCGRGVQSRPVVCMSGNMETYESNCPNDKPATRQDCIQAGCDTNRDHTEGLADALHCLDKITNCIDYGLSMCTGQYAAWAAGNCANFCGYCSAAQPSSLLLPLSFTSSPSCEDKSADCARYGHTICVGDHADWARENCPKLCDSCSSCSSCQQTTSPSLSSLTCLDKISTCSLYGKSVCTGLYADWAKENCPQFCGYCETTTSSVSRPSRLLSIITTLSCEDRTTSCSAYGQSVCTGQYARWAELNCANFCGQCRATTSLSTVHTSTSSLHPQPSPPALLMNTSTSYEDKISYCSHYGKDICTGDYAEWAKVNCAQFCGYRTAVVSSFSTSTSQPSPASSNVQQDVTSTSCSNQHPSCSARGKMICIGKFEQWAKENCAEFCGYCISTPSAILATSLTSSTSPPPSQLTSSATSLLLGTVTTTTCENKVSYCAAYGQTICTGDYAQWAMENCSEFCGHCVATFSSRSDACVDKVTNCAHYDLTVCTMYASWASANCQKMCGHC